MANIKTIIKELTIDRNIYLLNLKCLISNHKKHRKIGEMISKLSPIDSILHFEEFKKSLQPYLAEKENLSHVIIGAESLHYGHLEALYGYAGMKQKVNACVFPAVEHAVKFNYIPSRSEEEIARYSNFICQSDYMKESIHDINSSKPVFCIGTYLQYVEGYYNESEMQGLKDRFGRTILVFPSHTLESDSHEREDEDIVNEVFKIVEGKYDTVMVSAYWADLDWELYREFEKRGAVMVSCGYREDPLFIRRLKSLFELSDLVVVNSVASPVGFAKFMNKPLKLIMKAESDIESISKEGNEQLHLQRYNRLVSLLCKDELSLEEEMILEELYDYFCGSEKLLRTQSELLAIMQICTEIMKRTKGNIHKQNKVVGMLLLEYRMNSEVKYRLLQEALQNN